MLVSGKNVFNEIDPKNIKKLYIEKNSLSKYIDIIKKNNLKYDLVDRKVLDNMVPKKNQGIIAQVNDYEYKDLKECFNDDLVVMLDHLEDPHNLGAIIRSCECAGVKHIIIPKDRSVSVNETVIKVSTGAISYVDIIMVSNLSNAIDKLKKENFFVYGADMDGTDCKNVDFSGKNVLVIGNEGKGISQIVSQNCDEIISIPMNGKINSLNASVSAGILIFKMKGLS